MSWKGGQNISLKYTLKRKSVCIQFCQVDCLLYVCGWGYIESSCFRLCVRLMVLGFYACVSASLVCWCFIHAGKKKSPHEITLLVSLPPLFLRGGERGKQHIVQLFTAVTQVKHVTCR